MNPTVMAADLAPAETHDAPKKITVLHLIHSVCHGGIESVLINWVRFLPRDRVNVLVACFAGDRNREQAFLASAERAGIQVLFVPWTKYKPFVRASRAVAEIVREHGVDVIHTHAYYADVAGAMTKMFVKVKTVATVYVWGKYEVHRQIMQALDWTALHFVDKVTAHCEDTFEKTVRLGFSRERVNKLIAGFPAHEVQRYTSAERLAARRALGVRDDEVLMLNVARIHPEKAHDQLLKSFAVVHREHPKTKLWICGVGFPSLEADLRQLRTDLRLDDSVEFIGFHGDLTKYLNVADIMVHPSHVEGVPIAILLGMSAGLPIVVSDVGGVREVIKQGKTGYLIPENDVASFAAQVSHLVADASAARQLGDGARRFVSTEYSIQTAVADVVRTYEEVLQA